MNTLVAIAAFAVLVVACQGATTTKMPHSTHRHHSHASGATHVHHTHTTGEPNEGAKFSFFYVSLTHNLIVRHANSCYIATLTADELSKVHTDVGMTAIEIRLIGQLSAATATTNATLHAAELKHCGHNIANFYTLA